MQELSSNLEDLCTNLSMAIRAQSEADLSFKSKPSKWSKKEIIGHLIDSGIYNLQRFTEIQFKEKPYRTRSYAQNELVKANRYQEAESRELLNLLLALNKRISELMRNQNDESLKYQVLSDDAQFDLEFLMQDYVAHFKHHCQQILS